MHTASQCDMILYALRGGDKLTDNDARRRFRCSRLAARVNDLKKRGHKIDSRMIGLGNGKRVAEYSLAPQGQMALF